MLGYLRSAKKEHGLLMNFGGYRFQIRKYAMSQESLDPKPLFLSLFFCAFCAFLRLFRFS
jgi:hypothetical protein